MRYETIKIVKTENEQRQKEVLHIGSLWKAEEAERYSVKIE